MSDFSQMNLSAPIMAALERIGYQTPTPIQLEAIPLIQKGQDLIALAETGSGKTATCAIPICDRVDTSSPKIQALIVVPTRELALQYATEAQKIGKEKGVKAFAIFGGEDPCLQQAKLKDGVQVLVATPGRLIDFIYSRTIVLDAVATIILDEADEMLSMGFYEDLEFIIRCLVHEHQTLLFSATMANAIKKLALQHMINPIEVSLVGERSTPKLIEHRFLYCNARQRVDKLLELIKDAKSKQAMVFCQSRRQCEDVFHYLKKQLANVDYLHGGLTQDLRTKVTDKFRSGRTRFIIATDVAARGLDFSSVTHVFIFELSNDPDAYIHRSGRTGRSGRSGIVTTLVTPRELSVLSRILERIEQKPVWLGGPPPSKKGEEAPSGERRRSMRKRHSGSDSGASGPPRPKVEDGMPSH